MAQTRNKEVAERQPTSAWELQALNRIRWLKREATEAKARRKAAEDARRKAKPPLPPEPYSSGWYDEVFAEITVLLANATAFITTSPKIRSWLRGTRVEGAWTNIHAAHARLVELATGSQSAALVPEVREAATSYLPKSHSCHARLAKLVEPVDESEREFLSNTLNSAYAANAESYTRLRRYRNILLGWSLLFAGLALVLSVLGMAKPSVLSVCFPMASSTQSDAEGKKPVELVCPTGKDRPTGGDVPLVALLGLIGGTIGGTASVTRSSRPTITAYTLRVARACLKIAVGAVSGILGLLVLSAGLAPGFETLTSPTAILVYALVFGSSQQLLTQAADKTSERVLKGASPRPDTDSDEPTTA